MSEIKVLEMEDVQTSQESVPEQSPSTARFDADDTKNMKKDNTWNVSVNTERPNIDDDEAHLKVSYTPGKKGGNFGLPLGAKMIVPDGVFSKKDSITCQVAAPTQRWRYTPVLSPSEHLTSEIFIFSSTLHPLKKPIVIQLPYYQVDSEHVEINVKGKWKDENEWVDVGFLKKKFYDYSIGEFRQGCTIRLEKAERVTYGKHLSSTYDKIKDRGTFDQDGTKTPCVELEIDRLGIFAVTFAPKKEVFEVTTQGCLYNARLSKYISVRFPKKAADRAFQCSIQIKPIGPEKVQLARELYPADTSDLLLVSEIIDLTPDTDITFKRAVSIKLPLPAGLEIEDDNSTNDVAVLQKTSNGWQVVEVNYKFTRTTVTFDVKELSRFCIAQAKPDRKKVLFRAMTVLEGRMDTERGELLIFINLQEKFWVMILECFSLSRKEERIAVRKAKGYKYIEKSQIGKEEHDKKMFKKLGQNNTTKPQKEAAFEIYDCMKWGIEVTDDIKVSFESDFLDNNELQFLKFLPESYRRFVIEPKTNEEKALVGCVNFVPVNEKDTLAKMASTIKFKVEISEEAVKAYFKPEFIPEEPEPEKHRPTIDLSMFDVKQEKKEETLMPKFKPIPPAVMERLMKTSRKPIVLDKESKCLSGKSLMALSKLVPEGLTLAVHLDLPDSTITGLGFDAISNGLGMVDVTYKILLYWKRQMKDKKDGAIEVLSMALKDMGRADIAKVLTERHKSNKELTIDCFAQPS